MKLTTEHQTPTELWNQIKGKAQYYRTAYFGHTCVSIVRVACEGTFTIEHPSFGQMDVGCHELTEYCL